MLIFDSSTYYYYYSKREYLNRVGTAIKDLTNEAQQTFLQGMFHVYKYLRIPNFFLLLNT